MMRRPDAVSFWYDILLCSVALGCLFASPLGLTYKIGIAAAFLAIVNAIMEVGLMLLRADFARRIRTALSAAATSREAPAIGDDRGADESAATAPMNEYVKADLAGMLLHNAIVVAGGIALAAVMHLAAR
jgi:hypothetical protein